MTNEPGGTGPSAPFGTACFGRSGTGRCEVKPAWTTTEGCPPRDVAEGLVVTGEALTPARVIERALVQRDEWTQSEGEAVMAALDRAGYVIVPRHPVVFGRTGEQCLNYADALEGALHLLDDEDSAQKLAVLADQWRAEAGATPRKDAET